MAAVRGSYMGLGSYVCESTDIKDMVQDGVPHSFHHVQDKAKQSSFISYYMSYSVG